MARSPQPSHLVQHMTPASSLYCATYRFGAPGFTSRRSHAHDKFRLSWILLGTKVITSNPVRRTVITCNYMGCNYDGRLRPSYTLTS